MAEQGLLKAWMSERKAKADERAQIAERQRRIDEASLEEAVALYKKNTGKQADFEVLTEMTGCAPYRIRNFLRERASEQRQRCIEIERSQRLAKQALARRKIRKAAIRFLEPPKPSEMDTAIFELSYLFWFGLPEQGISGIGSDDYKRAELIIMYCLVHNIEVNEIFLDRWIIPRVTWRSQTFPAPSPGHIQHLRTHCEEFLLTAMYYDDGDTEAGKLSRLVGQRLTEISVWRSAALEFLEVPFEEIEDA